MTSNYEAIRADNIRRRGEEFEDVGRFLSERLYSDQTHFIYELLQNAQDALKRRSKNQPDCKYPKSVFFSLFPDRLELRHFGQLFNEDDVKGISDIFRGTKALDNEQIGKFGIGFKSVYGFTESPEIHSGDEHFKIEQYIRPYPTQSVNLRDGETLFVFPFNHKEKSAKHCYQRIQNRLADLGLRTLLFLDEIDQIVWDLEGKRSGVYIREKTQFQPNIWKVTLLGEENQKTTEEQWLIFQQWAEESNSNIEIAFDLDQDDKTKKDIIKPVDQSSLFAYFATDKETRLRFLIQGHYHTTPSRDNVADDDFNHQLISATAKLLVSSLLNLKSMGLLSTQTLEVMPLRKELFPPNSFFRPIYDEFCTAMKTLELLPDIDGGFIMTEQAKLARSTELIELLPQESLKALFRFSKNYQWLSSEITRDKTPELRNFLMNELDIDEIDPEKFAKQITQVFLEKQSDDWFVRFYVFLEGQKALWRPKTYYNEGALRFKPFIRTENDKLVTPFDREGNPQVFLPSLNETDFPIVKRSIANNDASKPFLNSLGLEEPDRIDEVLKYVIPKYQKDKINVSDEIHIQHLRKIVSALDVATGSKKIRLLAQLAETSFLRAYTPGIANREYKKPGEIYIDNEELRFYFEGNPNVFFYDMIYRQYLDLLDDLGVERQIHMEHHHHKGYPVELSDWPHIRGTDGFDPDWDVDGLWFAVENPTIVRSKIIWDEILRPNKHLIRGEIERSNRKDYTRSTKENKLSKAGELLIQNEWLPSKAGTFHMPSELSLDDLPEDFFRDEELYNQLGMKGITSSAFARERKIDESLFALGLEVMHSVPDLFKEFALKILNKQTEIIPSKKFNFLSDLEEMLAKPGIKDIEDEIEELPPSVILNPERRRELTQEEILAAMLSEPEKDLRFKLLPVRITEEKDKSVRGFLYEEYQGKCQICGDTFKKRTGRYYFEGLYLVSRLNAQWVDRPGNVLCLCANCCAKFQFGPLVIENLKEQILNIKVKNEGGNGRPGIIIDLCGETLEIKYTERHMLDLQEIIKISQGQQSEKLNWE